MSRTFGEWMVYIAQQYWPLFLRGTGITLLIAITGTMIGFLIGLLVAIAKSIPLKKSDNIVKKALVKFLSWVLAVYVEVFRGTPMIVQAMIIYYGSAQYLNFHMPYLFAGILIISVNTGAYMAEIVRGGITSVDIGQTEGAMSIGMTHWQCMRSVVLPQAIRNIMPSIGNEFIINIKDSAVLNVIGVSELFLMTKSAAGTYYRFSEAYIIAALIYLVLTFSISRILRVIEKKMDGPDTYEINGKGHGKVLLREGE